MTKKKIISTKEVLFGMPRIEGRRISVYNIISNLWNDRNINEYCELFELSKEDVLGALSYCKELDCQKNNVIQFCDGCVLNSINQLNTFKLKLKKIDENLFIDEKNNFYINTSESSIENEEFGYMGWVRAEILYKEITQ